MICSDVKVTAAVRFLSAEVGETWVANKPGGLNVRNSDDLESSSCIKSLCRANSALVKKVVFDQVQCSPHEFHNPELDVCET